MGMPLELNTMIVTKGNEKRQNDNIFTLEKSGYRLYPIDIPLEVRYSKDSENRATAVIQKVEWANETTIVTYKLVSLHSIN
ncbi:DUF2584 domain-containing protein [Lederbergia citrea]|uniref:DUF2584 domain-containing protein n=1 Tax=Lederbergia citrea TaxID=2833581 RepID=A0A942UJZ3_9BACI|nr:DUF2584 domain-containing protein [Lederbergia citrea]MBS4175937.1 DUF2584 domain-containing protein [Lederbergia citrea]MBS4202495.1 DUF2584 domain-containing protein [Lederbergia citrea]MBS4222835.1 DUF2584 domain-containing protein [Lederbergia citrea]